MVAERIEQTRDTMKRAGRRLADLDGEALGDLMGAEQSIYLFWQMLASPPNLVAEAIQAQTNAWARPQEPRYPPRPDQPDAAQLTKLFDHRFGPWADQVQQQAQADTNAPSLTPEARAEIERRLAETLTLHEQILQAGATGGAQMADAQFQALKHLIRIQELLPRDKSGSPPPQQQEQQQQQQEQQQEQQKPPEDQEQQKQQPEEQEKPEEPPPEAQEVLRRALEREKEHEADKRRQMREFPMAPGARDW